MLEYIVDPEDPRLAPYREIRDRHLRRGTGLFIAESELVVRRLLSSPLRVHSVLASSARAADLAALRPEASVLAAEPTLLKQVVGFPFHRGVLGLGYRPENVVAPAVVRRALVIEDLTDVDNLGSLMRIGAAFGVDFILLSPRCADPYYRKALRTAVGATFGLPIVRATSWPEDALRLRRQHGLRLIAAVLDERATPLGRYATRQPFALCVGSEGPGLSPALRAICDDGVTIPMAGVDSLNVAVAAAVILHTLASGAAVPL
jgi:tRNA G18 (ribose-2'-O)-methylase SpoU